MKILLLGGCGSVGSRYAAILRYMKQDFIIKDPMRRDAETFPSPNDYDAAIVATPTKSHYAICKKLIAFEKPFLCEKPLSKDIDECKDLIVQAKRKKVEGYVVCNYQYALGKYFSPGDHIAYDYYKTGKDGLYWDACQLLYLDPGASINNQSPIWHLQVNYKWVPYKMLERSYSLMVQKFVHKHTMTLWTLKDGLKMTEIVLSRMKREES